MNETVDENIIQPAHAEEDTFGEQYFPKQMSWYAPEGPQGWVEEGARKVREHPWLAMGVAVVAGLALGMLTKPLLRAGMSMAMKPREAEAEGEALSDCSCCGEE